jgi:hypothetical protein
MPLRAMRKTPHWDVERIRRDRFFSTVSAEKMTIVEVAKRCIRFEFSAPRATTGTSSICVTAGAFLVENCPRP